MWCWRHGANRGLVHHAHLLCAVDSWEGRSKTTLVLLATKTVIDCSRMWLTMWSKKSIVIILLFFLKDHKLVNVASAMAWHISDIFLATDDGCCLFHFIYEIKFIWNWMSIANRMFIGICCWLCASDLKKLLGASFTTLSEMFFFWAIG